MSTSHHFHPYLLSYGLRGRPPRERPPNQHSAPTPPCNRPTTAPQAPQNCPSSPNNQPAFRRTRRNPRQMLPQRPHQQPQPQNPAQLPHLSPPRGNFAQPLCQEENWTLQSSFPMMEPKVPEFLLKSKQNSEITLGLVHFWTAGPNIAVTMTADPYQQVRSLRRENYMRAVKHISQETYSFWKDMKVMTTSNNHAGEAMGSNPKPDSKALGNMVWRIETLTLNPLSLRLGTLEEEGVIFLPIPDILGVKLALLAFDIPRADCKEFLVELYPKQVKSQGWKNGLNIDQERPRWLAQCSYQNNSYNPMKILMWNVRGAGSSAFRSHLMQQLDIHKPSIVIITETKVSGDVATNMCKSLPYTRFSIMDAIGFKGGIWILWDDHEVHLDILQKTEQEIHALVKVPDLCPAESHT
ncbi:uncharacterized protein [Coffea arabica]|uniref:Endonuclease/exonuclease/phosphatase domain-containing protein n=1 Tax=Coffea arabica TaxID=13443 RepID=A0ABM4VTR4_COFAR